MPKPLIALPCTARELEDALHRFATIRAEALSLAREIENHKRERET